MSTQRRPTSAGLDLPDVAASAPDDGIDLSLVQWMLSLSPLERLTWCEKQAEAIRQLRALNPDGRLG